MTFNITRYFCLIIAITSVYPSKYSYAARHWNGLLEYSMNNGSYTETRSSGTSLTTNITGMIYQLSAGISTYGGDNQSGKTLEWRLTGGAAYMASFNGIKFPMPWFAELDLSFRHFLGSHISPFVGAEYHQILLAQVIFSSTYQVETLSPLWALVGIDVNLSVKGHELCLRPEGGYTPYAQGVSSTATLNHTGWKVGLKGTYSFSHTPSHGVYVGFDGNSMTLTGDTQLSGLTLAGLLGYRF